jgi:hypothetical protein
VEEKEESELDEDEKIEVEREDTDHALLLLCSRLCLQTGTASSLAAPAASAFSLYLGETLHFLGLISRYAFVLQQNGRGGGFKL